jgi:predicted O-methyltransferase YrrM
MLLPQRLRRLVPDRVRDDVRLRAVAVGSGLIPPRTMHSAAEAALLAELAQGRTRVVEVGVYEGSSAVVLCRMLGSGAELHLIDPFGHHSTALPPGWGATERASKAVVARAVRRSPGGGPRVTWHVALSEEAARGWSAPVDLVFVDGDHSEAGCALDWELWSPHVVEGGAVVFHDARASRPGGVGLPGPTAVVDRLFRGEDAVPGWAILREADGAVAVTRQAGAGSGSGSAARSAS